MFNYDKVTNSTGDGASNKLFPNLFRCLIIGPSGCGKTNLLINLLINKNVSPLNYQKVYIYSKTLNQPKYKFLKTFYENISKQLKVDNIATFIDSEEDILDPSLVDDKLKTLFVFDDVLLDKQNIIEKYFAQGRNSNVNS